MTEQELNTQALDTNDNMIDYYTNELVSELGKKNPQDFTIENCIKELKIRFSIRRAMKFYIDEKAKETGDMYDHTNV